MEYRKNVLECLGRFPEPCPLNTEIVQVLDKGSHTQETVRYTVQPEEYIHAYLLVPKQLKVKNPAIIASHQHNGEYFLGKSEPAGLSQNSMYHYGLELCLRGYVVLCPDHLGFEDRRPPEYKRAENSNLDGGSFERLLFCKYLSQGSSLQTKYLSDLSRGVDLLASLDYVDAERIGAIGHSLGGQETLWLSWYDDRIKVGVSSCGFSQIQTILRDGINHNFAMFTNGFLRYGDIGDLVCNIAPKPFMMINGAKDSIFPIDGVRDIADKASEEYKKHSASDSFKSIIFEGAHSFPDDIRSEAYDWLDRFLQVRMI